MTIDELLDKLDDMFDKAWSLPLSGGRCVIDVETAKSIVDDIRINMPMEIKQARAIVADRLEIISTAKKEGESVIRSAEERAKAMIAQEEIVRQAQLKANDIMAQSQNKSREMRKAATDYIDNIMKRTEEALVTNLQDVRQTRQNLKTSVRMGPEDTAENR